MRLLHTSDWHLGMSIRGGMSYSDDQKYAISQICDIAKREQVDGIIVAGDIFDKSIASQEAVRLYDDIVTNICDTFNIPVYIIAGNHDGADRLSQCAKLLRKTGLYICGNIEREPFAISDGDTDIYMLPWISTDKVKAVYPEEAENISNIEDAYRIVLDRYRQSFKDGHKNVLVAHAYVSGASDCGSDMNEIVGKAVLVNADVFEGFDYVALGHLHGPQQVTEKIRYSGTPMAYSFGNEEKQVKSVTIYDSKTDEQKIIELTLLRKRTTIKDSLDKLLEADYDDDIKNGFVRLEVTDKYVGFEIAALLRERYKLLVDYTCPTIEGDRDTITMSVEELERASKDPMAIFKSYCDDNLSTEPSDWLIKAFENACKEFFEEDSEL